MEVILKRIIGIRKAKKTSQKEIADSLGISQAAYAKFESGKSITVERLYKIAELLNISVSELLEIEITKINSEMNDKLISENESLKEQIEEFKSRIKEKDSLIKNAKDKLINEIVLTHYDMILDYKDRLEGVANMVERQELVKELDFVYLHEKERFNKLIATGFIELRDLEENQIYIWFHSTQISDSYSRFIEPFLGKLPL